VPLGSVSGERRRELHRLIQARQALRFYVASTPYKAHLAVTSGRPQALLTGLRLALALLQGSLCLNDLACDLLVKLIFIFIELLSKVLLRFFNLTAQLLDVLCRLSILNEHGSFETRSSRI